MIYMPRTIPSRILVSSLLFIIAFMAAVELSQAKRAQPLGLSYFTGRDVKMRRGGCASFGHSCFGGHGKRAVPVSNSGDPEEIPVGIQRPSDGFLGDGTLPQMEIFSRDDGQLDANGLSMLLKQQKYREPDDFTQLALFLRKLLNRRQDVPVDNSTHQSRLSASSQRYLQFCSERVLHERQSFDVFAAEEKYPDEEPTSTKDIVQSILNETLHSVFGNLEKVSDSNQIGDCNIKEDFLPQFGYISVNSSESVPSKINETHEEKKLQCEDKTKEYKVIKEQALADNELRIQNAKVHLQTNNTEKATTNPAQEANSTEKVSAKEQALKEIGEINFKLNAQIEEDSSNANNKGEEKITENSCRGTKTEVAVDHRKDDVPKDGTERCESQPTESFTDENTVHETESVHLHGIPLASGAPSVTAFKSQKFNDSYDFETNGAMYSMSLSKSDESFIESSESVIQIIEPQEDSNEETEEGEVSFSLPHELVTTFRNIEGQLEDDEPNFGSREREENGEFPKIRSGMTTVGPVKNPNHDPKVLAGPEIDYGKLTRISGSRELKKESTSASLHSINSKKMYINDSDDNPVIFFENGYMEFDTIVNHDIASMTKVQRVKEVLSDQPQVEEELGAEEKLMRPPLDLKDVDTESIDSYNVIDIGIPLITIEEASRNTDKEFGQNMQIILNGTNAEGAAPSETETEKKDSSFSIVKEEEIEKAQKSSQNVTNTEKELKSVEDHPLISPSFSCNKSVTQLNVSQKHNTISRVFQKASNRFIMKDSDSFLRNSKSLPRDTSKMANTESFKSLLDDYQASAATVLKKSRSLLRNTQNVLKAVSRTGFGHSISGDKQVYAASDVTVEQTESLQSTSSKKNEFLRLKDSIKSRVGKTLKSLENITSSDIRGTANDRQELKNISKPPLRSPLVCAYQFPQSQSCEAKKVEGPLTTEEGPGTADKCASNQQVAKTDVKNDDRNALLDGNYPEKEIEVLCDVKFQKNDLFAGTRTYSNSVPEDLNDNTSDQIDYVVMETIHDVSEPQILNGMETGSSNESNRKVYVTNSAENITPSNNLYLKNCSDATKSFTMPMDSSLQGDILEEFIADEGSDLQKSLSNVKLKRKNKKLSARIRSFWQTAFGKVKATSQKKEVS